MYTYHLKMTLLTTNYVAAASTFTICVVDFGVVSIHTINFEEKIMV